MNRYYNRKAYGQKNREQHVYELSKKNKYYCYEHYKKNSPDPIKNDGTWEKLIADEFLI